MSMPKESFIPHWRMHAVQRPDPKNTSMQNAESNPFPDTRALTASRKDGRSSPTRCLGPGGDVRPCHALWGCEAPGSQAPRTNVSPGYRPCQALLLRILPPCCKPSNGVRPCDFGSTCQSTPSEPSNAVACRLSFPSCLPCHCLYPQKDSADPPTCVCWHCWGSPWQQEEAMATTTCGNALDGYQGCWRMQCPKSYHRPAGS